jgi:ubiquinone/menaquinone biosynthesis C-methylase UbiE
MKASYDAIADTYNAEFNKPEDTLRLDYLGHLLARLQSANKSNNGDSTNTANMLELGCGAGVPATKFLLEQSNPVFHVTGNDISTSQLNLARTNLSAYKDRLTLVEGDMLNLSFPPASFDAITGFYSIIHLPRDEQTQLMTKIAEWVKPGGYFLANFSVMAMPKLEEEKWLGHEKGWMFWSGWGEDKSVEMVEKAGFEVEVREVKQAEGDVAFVWVLAKKVGK